MKNSKRIICRKVIKYIVRAMLILLALYNLVFVTTYEYDKEFSLKWLGMNARIIENSSMGPSIKKKDVVVITKPHNLEVGDIITFFQNGQHKIRRIIKINDNGVKKSYVTKGDNYFYCDEWQMEAKQIEGKVVKTLKLSGIIIKILRSKGLLIFNGAVVILISAYNKRLQLKKKNRRKIKSETNSI